MSSRDTEGVAAIYFFIAVRDCFVTTLPAYRRQACLSADRLAMTILINPNSKVKHELFDFYNLARELQSIQNDSEHLFLLF